MTPTQTFTLHRGSAPVLVSMPHIGTDIPEVLRTDFEPRALQAEDTDWHLHRLYNFLPALGASVLRPTFSRYVIDLNRPSDDAPMYAGAANTELCPTRFFTGEILYRDGSAPSVDERARRRRVYWQPYHQALTDELSRLRSLHGFALLWDAHSIRSRIQWLFDGNLPDLNVGTADGASAHPSITAAVAAGCADTLPFTYAINGRFKGGYITRHYGRPDTGVNAVQLEICQRLYMQETAPYAYDEAKAADVQPTLEHLMRRALAAYTDQYVR